MNIIGGLYVFQNTAWICTLVCQVVVCWSRFTDEEFVRGWFTWDHIILHSETPISRRWKGNHICRMSPLSACSFSRWRAMHAKTAKWDHAGKKKERIKKSSLMSYYCWKSDTGRVRVGLVRDCCDTWMYSDCWKRISFFSTSSFSSSSQQAISANDLRSFSDLASAIQRIMNNVLSLKL